MPDMTEIAEQNAEALAPAETEAPDEVQAAWDAASKAAEPEAAAAEVEKPADDPEERINSVLRAREEAHKKRLEAEDYAARMRKDAETQAEKIREEARAEARRIAAEELAAERAKWRSSPAATARALAGGDVDSFVQGILKEGTPEYAAEQARQKELAELREDAKVGKSAKEELEAFKKEQAAEKEQALINQVRTQFLSEHASPEKTPYMHARWEPEEVFDRCNAVAKSWQEDGLVFGKDFDAATVAAYLEKQSRERYSSRVPGQPPAQQSGAGTPAKGSGVAPKSAANGMRTITAANSSERRASPKPFNSLTPEEQKADLLRVAEEAYRQHGG
jgi:hypothetical protein